MQINPINPEQVTFFWPTIAHFIEASQLRGPTDMTAEQMRDCCRDDESWRLLIIEHFEAAAIIRVWDDRLHVAALGGKLEPGWKDLFFPWLIRLARFFGLRYVTLGGRKGWRRVLKRYGFVPLDDVFLGYEVPPMEVDL